MSLLGGSGGTGGAGSTGGVTLRPENKYNKYCDALVVVTRYQRWSQLPGKVLVPCGKRRWFLAPPLCNSCQEVRLKMAQSICEAVGRFLAWKPSS